MTRDSQVAAIFIADLLSKMGWPVCAEVAASACTGFAPQTNLDDFAEAVSLLGVSAQVVKKVPVGWRDGREGALIFLRDGRLYAQTRYDGVLETLPTNAPKQDLSFQAGERVLHIEPVPVNEAAALTFNDFSARARRTFRHGIWQSLAVNLCALSVPFFTMAVYDRVLGGAAVSSLPALLSGAVLVLVIMFILRRIRAHMFASEYARFGASVSLAVVHRLFRQPFVARDRQDAETAMARIRGAERTADLFSSKNTQAIYDAPFIILTVIALVIVGGVLAVIPALYLVVFLVIGLVLGWTRSETDPVRSRLVKKHRALVADLPYAVDIRTKGLSAQWLDKFDQLSRATARATHAAQQRPALIQSIGTTLGTGTALITLVVGLDLALQGHLSPGTLIGTMLLTWRITGPAQGLFLAMPRLRALSDAWRQLKPLLDLPVIHSASHAQDHAPTTPKLIKAEGLFVRYATGADPALTGVSFDIPPGSVVAVIGPNGSGKSTLLRLLSGALETQSGRLMLGGRSLSHFSPDSLAEKVAYLPADPRDCANVAPMLSENVLIDEVVSEEAAWQATIARDAPMFVLDDPLSVSGPDALAKIETFVTKNRGDSTIIFATHDTKLVQLADIAIVLENGSLVYSGPVNASENAADGSIVTAKETTP